MFKHLSRTLCLQNALSPDVHYFHLIPSCLFRLLRFQCLLSIAPNHYHRQERANDSGSKEYENDWDANGPDSWWEEAVEWMVFVDEWLYYNQLSWLPGEIRYWQYTINNVHTV